MCVCDPPSTPPPPRPVSAEILRQRARLENARLVAAGQTPEMIPRVQRELFLDLLALRPLPLRLLPCPLCPPVTCLPLTDFFVSAVFEERLRSLAQRVGFPEQAASVDHLWEWMQSRRQGELRRRNLARFEELAGVVRASLTELRETPAAENRLMQRFQVLHR